MSVARTAITTAIAFSFLILLFSSISFAQTADGPALPNFFYGKATVNGKNAPVGSVVIAKINDAKRGEVKVDTIGVYAKKEGSTKLGVSGSRATLGSTIEFYIKLPKLKEIKATRTAKWSAGSITELDLTFAGEEIIDNSTIEIEVVNSTKESFTFDSIIADRQVAVFLTSPLIPIMRLQLIVTANLSNVTFDFEVVDAINAPKLDNVYKYISINAPKINDAIVKTAIIRFKVPNSWLEQNGYDPQNVSLHRYKDAKWNKLETFHEGADANDNYYRASTPGFSYFAIRAEKAQQSNNATVTSQQKKTEAKAESKEEKKEEPKQENSQSSLSQVTAFVVEKTKQNPIIGVGLVLLGMLIGVLLTYYFVSRKKESR